MSEHQQDCLSNETVTKSSNSSTNSKPNESLSKLLIDTCNYEHLKKLSFQKLDELTKKSSFINNGNLKLNNDQSNTELNKSKSLTNLSNNLTNDQFKTDDSIKKDNEIQNEVQVESKKEIKSEIQIEIQDEIQDEIQNATKSEIEQTERDQFNLTIIENLKKENEQLNLTIANLQKEHTEQQEKASKELEQMRKDYNQQIEKINKQFESKTKELERVVVKYAMSEKQILDAQKVKDDFEKKLKDALKDKDSLLVRIKGLSNEKQSLINTLDSRVNEINNNQKEVDKIKKQLKEKEAQLMQFEFKLNKEIENQTETEKKLETSLKTIEELNKELNIYKISKTNEDEMTSINKSDLESKCKEIIELRTHNSELQDQNQTQQKRIKQLESDNNKFEEDKKRLTSAINDLKQEFSICNEKIEANKLLKLEYDEKVEQLELCSKELETARKENEELITESKAYRQKEGELLEFTDRLQTKTVQLQAEHNHFKQKCEELTGKFDELNDLIAKQIDEIDKLKTELVNTKKQHENELKILAKKLAEESNLKEKLKRQTDELENENKIMKKKHLTSIKELNKELISLRKKVEQQNEQITMNNEHNATISIQQHPNQETISISSRTNSSNSLERHSVLNGQINNESNHYDNSDNLIRTPYNNQILTPNFTDSNEIAQQIDKNVLLNKILTLQQQLGKLRSRVEFLEDHNNTLLEDIKKKSKLIQNFILREESGVLSSNDMDNFKNQVSKKGSVMASLYKNSVNDSSMTLELSLEINRKLQCVLEDTILKNITLKESIDTLGLEIERMSKKN